jgi:putative cell wall-binding protein
LATADNYPDALAGSVLAYQQNAPILLVGDTQEDQDKVLAYMKANANPSGNIYILGGTGAVGEDVVQQIKSADFTNVVRLGGTNRYETAAKIADYLKVDQGTPVILASGRIIQMLYL